MTNNCWYSPLPEAFSVHLEVVYRTPWRPRKSPLAGRFLGLLCVMLPLAAMALARSQSQAPPQPQPQPPSQQKEQSLGDSARKAKASKGKSEPHKVYTEEELSRLGRGSVSVVGQETTAAGDLPAARNPDAQPKAGGNEEYWRGKARELRDQMAELDQKIARLKGEIAKLCPVRVLSPECVMIDAVDRDARLKWLEEAEKRKEELQKQMELLEDEGRKAGALPAWFR